MAMIPLPAPGGTLFAPGGGMGGPAASVATSPLSTPGGIHTPSLGKNSMQQNLSSPHSGLRSTITSGEPLNRMMGQYGKNAAPGGGLMGSVGSPLKSIRGGTGTMRRIRGGLGPGRQGQPGTGSDYSMTSPDQE